MKKKKKLKRAQFENQMRRIKEEQTEAEKDEMNRRKKLFESLSEEKKRIDDEKKRIEIIEVINTNIRKKIEKIALNSTWHDYNWRSVAMEDQLVRREAKLDDDALLVPFVRAKIEDDNSVASFVHRRELKLKEKITRSKAIFEQFEANLQSEYKGAYEQWRAYEEIREQQTRDVARIAEEKLMREKEERAAEKARRDQAESEKLLSSLVSSQPIANLAPRGSYDGPSATTPSQKPDTYKPPQRSSAGESSVYSPKRQSPSSAPASAASFPSSDFTRQSAVSAPSAKATSSSDGGGFTRQSVTAQVPASVPAPAAAPASIPDSGSPAPSRYVPPSQRR